MTTTDSPVSKAFPTRARVVVIGGGVIGTSVAYHLAAEGCTDVVLLERDRLTSGTTWHAAGLMVTFGSMSQTSTRMRQYTRDLYARLEAETGQDTGLRQVGFIELASTADRRQEYRRVAEFNRYLGVDVHEITPREVGELFPLARLDDALAGFYVAEDGRANPVDVTMALGKGARQRGVQIIEGTPVTDVLVADPGTPRARVRGVRTAAGDIECETVVNCAGMWARELAARGGVAVPLQAAEHYYLVTEPIEGVHAGLPVLEDPQTYGYIREEGGALLVGLFEALAAPWRVEGIPADFSFGRIPPDWDRMSPYLEAAMSRVPATLDAGVRTFFCGPESFTPDMSPVVGEAPEVAGYFVAAGLNSIGILTGGGLGRAVAHWVLAGRPDVDVTAIDICRLQPFQTTPSYRRERTAEVLGSVYACHYPNKQFLTARGAKRSALHSRLVARGAHFRDVSGWEGADWYTAGGVGDAAVAEAPDAGPLTFGRPAWFEQWAREHHACRDDVVLMDMSFMAKFLVTGRDGGAMLEHLSAGHVDGADGVITYTQWLNEGGTLEADLTVSKLGGERWLVVASDTAHRHVGSILSRAVGRAQTGTLHVVGVPLTDVHAVDVTSGYTQLNVQGPRSRSLLQLLTTADLSNEAFDFRAVREIDLGYARVLCARITYLGELGYELYIPTEHALDVYDRLVGAGAGADPATGESFGLRHAGLKALAGLRMEKAYRDYGHDVDNLDPVDDVGLGFAVALTTPGPDGAPVDHHFVGRDAVLAQRAAWAGRTPPQRLVQVLLNDPETLLVHGEVLRRNATPVGYLRSASYGHTLGGAVGLAMVEPAGTDQAPDDGRLDPAWIAAGTWDVDVAGARIPATVSLRPLYDPSSARIKG
jgi:glycine/D-amino acid oxidase-like deaminating enzyme/glycine cleavage system aminomethyltransferase T